MCVFAAMPGGDPRAWLGGANGFRCGQTEAALADGVVDDAGGCPMLGQLGSSAWDWLGAVDRFGGVVWEDLRFHRGLGPTVGSDQRDAADAEDSG